METITIQMLSWLPHVSQIVTGFLLLEKKSQFQLKLENGSRETDKSFDGAYLRVLYRNKILIYDVSDGYQDTNAIRYYLEHCDLYFKRSFSLEKNTQLHSPYIHKMYPLGFNYHLSCKNHPCDYAAWREKIKKLLGRRCESSRTTAFTCRAFEETPRFSKKMPQVLFCTRLWDQEPGLSPGLLEEREKINQMRIAIIRTLRKEPGIRFLGGVADQPLARKMAPDLILPDRISDRTHYLRLVHQSDICIGSMGLHESIGWKTGEYVAASKAIVNETLHYQVPGNFTEGVHYLKYDTVEECVAAVRRLASDHQALYDMKCANRAYYQQYLRPDAMIRNTLQIAQKM